MASEIELEGTIKVRTAKAILFQTGMGEAWLPLSQIELEDAFADEGIGPTTILIAEWQAIDKGLV